MLSWGSRWETLKGVFCMRRRACRLSMEVLQKYNDETLSASIHCKVCAHGKRHSVGLGVLSL